MKNLFLFLFSLFIFSGFSLYGQNTTLVENETELASAIETAQPGSTILLVNGAWEDLQLVFTGKGTEAAPITLGAETPGKVKLTGESDLKLAGEYLVVRDLIFTDGHTPSKAVVEFRVDSENIANHCRVTNIVIEDYTQPDRNQSDLWVLFWGRNNQFDHSYLAGKFNAGPTLRVSLEGNRHIRTHHKITHNYFGPRPRKGGPKAETIQIGSSDTSMAPGYVTVANNYFDSCNGEIEVISNKASFNEFRNNIFFQSEGSLVLRHGNYCTVDGNIFIGDGSSPFYGGIRVINTGHLVTNNYFYDLRGEEFRGPLAMMNGIPKSPQNRYNQVTDVVVAFNSWVDSPTPWHLSVGANMAKNDVLPPTEIRSARPDRVIIANNLVYNSNIKAPLIRAYDSIDGIEFRNNMVNPYVQVNLVEEGIAARDLEMEKISEYLYVPAAGQDFLKEIFAGFEFEKIANDLAGKSRGETNQIGAFALSSYGDEADIDRDNYGPGWFNKNKPKQKPRTLRVTSGKESDLRRQLAAARPGDILQLQGTYKLDRPLGIDKKISLISGGKKATLELEAGPDIPVFLLEAEADLKLENLSIKGNGKEAAFATRKDSMYKGYNLKVKNLVVTDFGSILKSYKGSFADSLVIRNSHFSNAARGILLNAEKEDLGDYNAEFVVIENSVFEDIDKDVLDYYRGGYDESTIGGNLFITGSSFTRNGQKDDSKILIKTRGIVNVEISNNKFLENPVEVIALLWGEKGNVHSDNKIEDSGKFVVEEYLKLRLVY